jgi:NADH-quinone oxidoreductase subunit J
MFTEYVYPFELASVILLVGIVAAVALTQREKRRTSRSAPSQQVFVKARDRVRVLQMPPRSATDETRVCGSRPRPRQ